MDWNAKARQFVETMTDANRQQLADSLNLPLWALAALPLIGVERSQNSHPVFSFPETDSAGNVVGIQLRYICGNQKWGMVPGSKKGLYIPVGWNQLTGPVFVVEGASDTLAMRAAGLRAIGRPSNMGGAELLIKLFKTLPSNSVKIVVVGENDQKTRPDGSTQWPGRDGAISVSAKLAKALPQAVYWTLPPEL